MLETNLRFSWANLQVHLDGNPAYTTSNTKLIQNLVQSTNTHRTTEMQPEVSTIADKYSTLQSKLLEIQSWLSNLSIFQSSLPMTKPV